VLADRGVHELAVHLLVAQRVVEILAFPDDDRGRGQQHAMKEVEELEARHDDVEHAERRDDHDAADEGRIRPGHGGLHGVGHQEQEHEVMDRELPELALAEDAQSREQGDVDDHGAQDDLPPLNTEVDHSRRLSRPSISRMRT
jgi:hypothetical protein